MERHGAGSNLLFLMSCALQTLRASVQEQMPPCHPNNISQHTWDHRVSCCPKFNSKPVSRSMKKRGVLLGGRNRVNDKALFSNSIFLEYLCSFGSQFVKTLF